MKEAVELAHQRPLSYLENLGLILIFEYTHELAWNICQDFLQRKGVKELFGSIDTTRAAFKIGLINNEGVWMDMIASRNLTNESYLETIAAGIAGAVLETYFTAFEAFQSKFNQLQSEEQR